MIKITDHSSLAAVAECHIAAFPQALSSRLGLRYVTSMLAWYLESDRKFLFHYIKDGRVLGYCGGIYQDEETTETSATGMLQFSMRQAITSFLLHPWLLFHPEARRKIPLVVKNVRRKLFGVSPEVYHNWKKQLLHIEPYVGLIVIGVAASARGQGVGARLLEEFDRQARTYRVRQAKLTVNRNNRAALALYQKHGWAVASGEGASLNMAKVLT